MIVTFATLTICSCMIGCTALIIRAINRVYKRLARLPPRVIGTMNNGAITLYSED